MLNSGKAFQVCHHSFSVLGGGNRLRDEVEELLRMTFAHENMSFSISERAFCVIASGDMSSLWSHANMTAYCIQPNPNSFLFI